MRIPSGAGGGRVIVRLKLITTVVVAATGSSSDYVPQVSNKLPRFGGASFCKHLITKAPMKGLFHFTCASHLYLHSLWLSKPSTPRSCPAGRILDPPADKQRQLYVWLSRYWLVHKILSKGTIFILRGGYMKVLLLILVLGSVSMVGLADEGTPSVCQE